MIRCGVFKCSIEVSNRPRVFNGIIAERLMKIRSTTIALLLRQRVDKFCNFSNAIVGQFLDSVDEFLPFHTRNYSTLSHANRSSSSNSLLVELYANLTPRKK